jgi:hypothetical protein
MKAYSIAASSDSLWIVDLKSWMPYKFDEKK